MTATMIPSTKMTSTSLLVTGSRSITDMRVVAHVLTQVVDGLLAFEHHLSVTDLWHGGAEGVDELAGAWAHARSEGIRVHVVHPATDERDEYLRRDRMLVDLADHCVAIWDGESRGTKYTFTRAKAKGKLLTGQPFILAHAREEMGLDWTCL